MSESLFDEVLSNIGGAQRATVTGTAGGEAVVIELAGMTQVEKVTISPAAAGDISLLEELVAAAINDALKKAAASAKNDAMQLLQQFALK